MCNLSNYKASKTSANGKEEVATSTQVSKILMKFNIFHTFAQNKTSWARFSSQLEKKSVPIIYKNFR